jgi:starch-binding outer membrane protein, SusD/RagB family
MKMSRKVGAVLTGAAVLACAACSQDLNITNPNTPDVARALASPADVENLAVSSLDSWYLAALSAGGDPNPWGMLEVTGDLMTQNYGNYGARFNNLEPRIPYNNNQASGDAEVAQDPWQDEYGALGQANDVLRAVAAGTELPDGTAQFAALAQMSQAGALLELSLVYDRAFPVDENTTVANFVSYDSMATFTKGKIDKLIAATAGQSWTYTAGQFPASITTPPSNFANGGTEGSGLTASVINRLANTWGAQLLAFTPRTKAEAATANWAQVLAYAQKGIGTGTAGTPFDFSVIGDGGNSWYALYPAYADLPSWMMVDLHLISQMAPNVPNEYTGLPASPASAYDAVWAPQAPMDARLSTDLTNVNSYTTGVDDKTDYVYARQVQGSAARGIYMQSPYYHVRYISYSWQANNSFLGPMPMTLAAENDLIQAEALVRTGGNLATAAALVNNTRVGRGGLTPLTASTSTATFLQAIVYELEVETNSTDGYAYFALRGNDQVQPGTPRELPVPALELQTDNVAVYSCGGAGSGNGFAADPTGLCVGAPSLSIASASAGRQLSANLKQFQAGPFKTLNLPNGQTMQLPVPKPPPPAKRPSGKF